MTKAADTTAMTGEDAERASPRVRALAAILCVAIACSAVVLWIGIDEPLIDLHSYRQTQTALTAWWMLHGPITLAYQTPVAGYPWSIPFEFPIYQWIVALVSLCGVPLDVAGRSVSFLFFLATLLPLRRVFREVGPGRGAYLATAILYVLSPQYLYWGRAFLIETFEVFLCTSWLALVCAYARSRTTPTAMACLLLGCLACVTKATTYPAFAFVAACVLIHEALGRADARRMSPAHALMGGVIVLCPLVVGYAWVVYTDLVKEGSPIGTLLTSHALYTFNYGTIAQRLSRTTWIDVLVRRSLPDILGYAFLLPVAAAWPLLASRRHAIAAAICTIAFLIPWLAFTNLHFVHNYYQTANALFLIAAAGITIDRLFDVARISVAYSFLGMVAAGEVVAFAFAFAPQMWVDPSGNDWYQIALEAKAHTQPGQSLLVVGQEGTSIVPYYSERKSIVLTPGVPLRMASDIMRDPQPYAGDSKIGAYVLCKGANYLRFNVYKDFGKGHDVIARKGACTLLSPEPAG